VPTGRAAKDFGLYLGVLRNGELWKLHRIMSDGPSRGTMALETETAPREGSSIQVRHLFHDGVLWKQIHIFFE
jgi:hypothetical protein